MNPSFSTPRPPLPRTASGLAAITSSSGGGSSDDLYQGKRLSENVTRLTVNAASATVKAKRTSSAHLLNRPQQHTPSFGGAPRSANSAPYARKHGAARPPLGPTSGATPSLPDHSISPSWATARPPTTGSVRSGANPATRPSSTSRGLFSSSMSTSDFSATVGAAGSTTSMAKIDLTDVPSECKPILKRTVLEEVVKLAESNRRQSVSMGLGFEMAYTEMIQATSSMPATNGLRTATSCYMLDRLITALAPVELMQQQIGEDGVPRPSLLQRLKADVFSSIYVGTAPEDFIDLEQGGSGADGLRRLVGSQTYYEKEQDTAKRFQDKMDELEGENKVSEKQQLVMERIINRWQSMLVDRLFCAWRQHIKRNKNHDRAVIRLVKRHSRHEYLMWGFYHWRYETMKGVVTTSRADIETLHDLREKDQSSFIEESSRFMQQIEGLKEEQSQLQEQYKRLNDDAAGLRLTNEQLQYRFEQQKEMSQAWREGAVTLLKAITPPDISPPEDRLLPYAGEGSTHVDRLASWDDEAVHQTPVEKLTLMWVNSVVAKGEERVPLEGTTEQLSNSIRNFDEDFKNGKALLYVALGVEMITAGEAYSLGVKNSTATLSTVLPLLKSFCGYDVPLQPLDVSAGHPVMTYVLMSLVMEKSVRFAPSPEHFRTIVNRIEYFDDTVTVADLHDKGIEIARWHHKWDTLKYCARKHALGVLGKTSQVVDQNTVDSVVDRNLIRATLTIRNNISLEDTAGEVLLTEVCDAVALAASELHEMWGYYASTKTGMTHSKFNKFLSDTKMVNKAFPKKASASLFDFLLNEVDVQHSAFFASRRDSKMTNFFSFDDGESLATGIASEATTSLAMQQWVAALVHLAFLKDDRNTMNPSKKVTTLIQGAKSLCKASGLDEFRDMCYGKQVQDVFSKNNTLLSRIFEAAAGADDDPEMSFDEFLQVVKDAKLLDHNLSIEVCKKLFEFTQDAPWQEASMVYRDFLEAVVALSVFKIPSPWMPLAERVKAFLKESFLPPFVKRLKDKKR